MELSCVVLVFFLLLSTCLLVADGSIRITVNVVETETGPNIGVPGGLPKKGSMLSYSVVNERNETVFRGGDLAVFMGGRWCVAPSQVPANDNDNDNDNDNPTKGLRASRPLVVLEQETINGTEPGLGRYEGIRIRWSCNLEEHKSEPEDNNDSDNPTANTIVITSFLNFESKRAVVFDIGYPEGAENTSLVRFNHSDGDTATLATFPSFVMKESIGENEEDGDDDERTNSSSTSTKTKTNSYFPPTLPSALSWQGSFVQSVRGLSVGPKGGPTVFYNASDPALATVVVASPFFDGFGGGRESCRRASHDNNKCHHHHFNEFTAGNNRDWTGTIPSFSPGRSGRLTRIPPGSSQSILLYEGSNGGITSTIHEWGTIMQTVSAAVRVSSNSNSDDNSVTISPDALPALSTADHKNTKLRDVTLEKIGYQTDNGAMYCFCSQTNCSEVLLEEKAYLDSIGIPLGYLSFQGAGTSSGRGKAAPWCIEKWSADGGQDPNNYPLDTKAFQKALGIPLQLYAPYFCPNSTRYFQPDTPWKSVASNPNLPGCSGFAFETVRASDSKAFFEWFLDKGIENGGMASFESDFMDQNVNCVDDFVENPIHGADEFLEGMAGAALERNLPIQWCYASPNVVLASLNFPAVTNFRVSFDYCYGRSYEIGESSLLVWAVGAAPSKDTLWTTNNNRTETPGCAWTVDHETVAAELHVVLAIMSTGPVGISDAIGMTHATLLQRIISEDGSLLQPSKPITAVDSSFLEEDSKPHGYLYGTHGLDLSWIFVSFQLKDPFPVTLRDFWPPLAADPVAATAAAATTTRLVHRSFASNPECFDGANAVSSGCVTLVSLSREEIEGKTGGLPPIFVAPRSTYGSPGSDLSPSVVTVWKECPGSGVFFLGELDKYVSLSPKRFRTLDCSEEGVVSATVLGSMGEVIEVTLLVPHSTWYEVVKENITVSDPVGLVRFDYRTNDSLRHSGIVASETTADA